MGKIHIGYQFNLNHNRYLWDYIYKILFIIPGLFTHAYIPYILWIIFFKITFTISKFIKIEGGEFAAVWCFSSILFGIPIALFSKQFLELFQNIHFDIKNFFF